MRLHISYFVPPAPLVDARARGLLDGLEIIETRTDGSPAQLAGLLDGSLDVAVTAIDNLFEWTRAGADVRLVAQVEPTTPLTIIGNPDFAALEDLTGCRFAVDAFSNGFALVARAMLERAHVQVEYLEVGGVRERLDALLSGDTDATLLGPPFDQRALDAGMREIARVQDAFPAFPGQGLIVRTEVLDTPEIARLLSALRATGLLSVDPAGLDLLTEIRQELGALPSDADLRAVLI